MSSRITVLQDGYCRWDDKPNSMFANGTSTLVQTDGQNILVDTLGPWDHKKLVQYLANKRLTPDDIHLVVGTHLHTDHIGNLNLFTKCEQIVGDQKSREDYFQFDIFNDQKKVALFPNVDLYFTPGHTANDVSVVVHNCLDLGTVSIVGDLFESQADLEDDTLWIDAGSVSPDLQRENRQLILSLSDYIVPGHGGMFKVRK